MERLVQLRHGADAELSASRARPAFAIWSGLLSAVCLCSTLAAASAPSIESWPLCEFIGPGAQRPGVYGTDFGFTFRHPYRAADGSIDERIVFLFGDTWPTSGYDRGIFYASILIDELTRAVEPKQKGARAAELVWEVSPWNPYAVWLIKSRIELAPD